MVIQIDTGAGLMSTAETIDTISRAEHRYRLIKMGCAWQHLSFADIARSCKVDRSFVSHVARGRRVSRRVRIALARAVGIPYRELWGDGGAQ